MDRLQTLVVGGGIGGLALAVGLARRGRRVHVVEKAPEFGEVGAGLQLAPNASWALDRIGVLEAVARHAVFPEKLVWMDGTDGELLTELDLGARFVEHYGYRYVVMHRHDLLETLLATARNEPLVSLETSRDVIDAQSRDGYAVAVCADGTSYEAEVVIGCDGLKSNVRRAIHDDGEPMCSEYVAFRGTLPIEEASAHVGFDKVVVWTGAEMHLVQYPVRRGELFNQVAVFKSHCYTPDNDGWGNAEEMDERFSQGVPIVRAAVQKMWRGRRWPMFDRLPIPQWQTGRVVLLGDAAHPMLQYLAQGAAQALEDAAVLTELLGDFPDAPETAFRAYVAERAPRTARVQTEARAWGEYWHLGPGPQKSARDALLRARAIDDYTWSDWYYGYRGLGARV